MVEKYNSTLLIHTDISLLRYPQISENAVMRNVNTEESHVVVSFPGILFHSLSPGYTGGACCVLFVDDELKELLVPPRITKKHTICLAKQAR